MKHHFLRTALLATLSAGVPLSLGSTAFAGPDDALIEMARERFQEGVQFYDRGDYEKARLSFLQAYSLKKHPAVLLNLAQSELRSGQDAAAATHFALFLRENPVADKLERQEAEKGLAGARAKVAEVTIVAKENSEIFVNGSAEGRAPLAYPLYLEPGRHQIEARLAGDIATETPTLTGGQVTSLAVGVAPPQPSKLDAETVSPQTQGGAQERAVISVGLTPETEDSGPSKENPLQWAERQPMAFVGAGLGALGIVSTVTFGVLASNRYSNANGLRNQIIRNHRQLEPKPSEAPCDPRNGADYIRACNLWQDEKDSGDGFRAGAVISGVVGGAALVGTTVWYFLDRKSLEETTAGVTVAPTFDGENAGVVVGGSF